MVRENGSCRMLRMGMEQVTDSKNDKRLQKTTKGVCGEIWKSFRGVSLHFCSVESFQVVMFMDYMFINFV